MIAENVRSETSTPGILRILVIEDSEDDALFSIRELKKGGYNPVYEIVETAADMKKALKEKPWDIILCDYKMPQFDAPSAIALLKEIDIDIPLIIISGTIGEETAVECMRLGAHDYLMKDNLSRLCPAIARELKEKDIRNKKKRAEAQREAALEKSRESEERYRALFDRSLDLVYITDFEGRFIDANDAALNLLGYTREEIHSLHFASLLSEEQIPRALNVIREIQETGIQKDLSEFRLRHKNGSDVYVETQGSAVMFQGKPVAIQAIARDITERKQAEKALRRNENFLISLLNSIPLPVFYKDEQGRYLGFNRAFEDFFGSTKEQMIGKTVFDINPPDLAKIYHAKDKELLDKGVEQFYESQVRNSAGETRDVLFNKAVFTDDRGNVKGLIGTILDFTERKQAEKALRESEENFRLSLDDSPLGIRIVDADGNTLYANRAILDIYGYDSIEELRGTSLKKRYTPESYTEWEIRKEKRKRDELDPTEYEISIVRKNGEVRHLQVLRKRILWNGARHFQVIYQDITERKQMETQLREQLAEINKLKMHLQEENVYLRKEREIELGLNNIIGESAALRHVLSMVQKSAPTDATILIIGETGTGKGMVAHAIHGMSTRKDKPMVTINCSAIPENLIESELFGWEKGAFTGAHARQIGRFEVADGGTIFMDEIGEIPLAIQIKLLRVLQDGEFERLGSNKTIKVDVRLIAATNRNLKDDVCNGRFREDLFYRINVFPISMPPLRKRIEDIPLLVNHFIGKYTRKYGRKIEIVSESTMHKLQEYHWSGNVRELEHVIERAVITSSGSELVILDSLDRETVDKGTEPLKDLETTEREHILKVLQKTRWKIDGEGGAAIILGLNPSTLRFRIKKLGITHP